MSCLQTTIINCSGHEYKFAQIEKRIESTTSESMDNVQILNNNSAIQINENDARFRIGTLTVPRR